MVECPWGCDSTLWVIDVSSPTAPEPVASTEIPDEGEATNLAVSNGHVYVTSNTYENAYLTVIDIGTPSAPVVVGSATVEHATVGRIVSGLAVSGGFAYVTGYDEGFHVIDVGTPSEPVEVGLLETPSSEGWLVAVAGDHAFVAGVGLRVIDIGTPSMPMEVGHVPPQGVGAGIAVSNDHAYVIFEDPYGPVRYTLHVVDVARPTMPAQVGAHELALASKTEPFSRTHLGVTVAGGFVHVAAGEAGLYSFEECVRVSQPEVDPRFRIAD
jgi:hypothetical protein